jgi:hypothetical protein
MLNKCSGKDCSRKFKYFGLGLLYVMPSQRKSHDGEPELFWLCEQCAQRESELSLKRLPVIVGPALRRTA